MIDRLQALRDLLTKVEAGEWASGLAQLSIGGVQGYRNARNAFNGSLDAAKALHEAVLADWRVGTIGEFESKVWYIKIYKPMGAGWSKWEPYPSIEYSSAEPARAWLIAIIKALITQEEVKCS